MKKLNININETDLLSMLSELVSLDTSFPPGANYPDMVALLERMTLSLGGTQTRIKVPETLWQVSGLYGERTNLIVRPDLAPEGSPEVTIYFHIDTAPVGDGWIRPALEMTCEGNKIYARGTADMKGAIASAIAGLNALYAANHKFKFQPVLAFCTDEEGGIYPGIRYLAEQNLVSDTIINLNGSATPRVWAGSFGSLDLSFQFTGKAAHSGRPELGVNAIEQALPVFNALSELKNEVQMRISAMPAPPNADGPLHALLNITAIHGGEKGSALPGTCNLVVNRRYAPEEDVNEVRKEIHDCVMNAVNKSDLLGWEMTESGHLPPVQNTQGVTTPRWTASMSQGYGVPLEEFVSFGSTTSSDFGWIQQAGGRHREIMLGGLSRLDRNVHAADEFTTKEDLLGLAKSIALFFSADFVTKNDSINPTVSN